MAENVSESDLTIAERASLLVGKGYWDLNGIERLHLRSIRMSDGPNGLRRQLSEVDNLGSSRSEPAICFPTESCVACSFDVELVEQMGAAIAAEARSQGVDVVLGPGVNMKRSPLAGRNFEYFSEDPLLSGKLGAAYIRGMQRAGIGCSLKHFAANNQETDRLISDSVVDDIALRELYLEPFRICVEEASPQTIMPSYNLLNGKYCCESEFLLTEVARREWGFKGAFVSDWGAESSNRDSLPAGLDIVMPGPRADYAKDVIRMVEDSEIDEEVLDAAARRVMDLERQHASSSDDQGAASGMTVKERLGVALRLAEESAVLLENDGMLPIEPDLSISLIGAFAKQPRYQGAGSSRINPSELTNLADSLRDLGVRYSYSEAYDPSTGASTSEQMNDAIECAAASDIAIVVIGLPEGSESEGRDRDNMLLPPSHIELVNSACEVNDKVCVILQCGAPVELDFNTTPNAILLAYLGGCMGGLALARTLIGLCNPSGKLAETWPVRLEDTPCAGFFPAKGRQALYMESIFNGYRYYDSTDIDVAYPFGHGLSYSRFDYCGMQAQRNGEGSFEVTVTVRNIGTCSGREAVQLYASPPSDSRHLHAPKRLVGFSKVGLAPGCEAEVSITIGAEAFRRWDAEADDWAIVPGEHCLHAGRSSKDLLLECYVRVEGVADRRVHELPAEYAQIAKGGFSREGFEALYGRNLPAIPSTSKPFTQNSTIGEIRRYASGAVLLRLMIFGAKLLVRGNPKIRNLLDNLGPDTPLRELSMSGVDMRIIYGAVEILNLHLAKGMGLIRKGLGSLLKKVPRD